MTRPDPAPGIFYMYDSSNIDPATVPDWGPFGSWMWWEWSALNPADNSYNWAVIENYLATAAALGKKVAVSVMLYKDVGYDATPLWVYGQDSEGNQLYGWPILPEATQTFPKWNDGGRWDYYYHKFVDAFGARFNGDARIHSIWICTARYGETVISGLGTNTHNHGLFFRNSVDWYSAAFPDTPLFLIHSAADTRRMLALYCDQNDVHSKMNVLGADLQNHTYNAPWAPAESGTAEVGYYATLGWPTATQSYPGLGHWMAYEHGDIEANPEDMYNAMLVALCHGARCVDFSNDVGSTLLQQLADVDDSLLGNFWDFCLRIMGHPLEQVAMWVGRNTIYRTLSDGYEKGWDGPWTRGNITVNATGYAIDEATYLSAPAALTAAGVEYGDAGIGYCSAANLTVSVQGMPPGDYTVTTIYSVTGAGAAWAVESDTLTVAQDGTGSVNVRSGPCWVHLIVVEPDSVSETNLPPNAPIAPQCEGQTNPVAVTDLTPEFSWTFSDPNSGDSQTAYQIVVGTSPVAVGNFVGVLWDSGKVTSGSSSGISYAGTALEYNTTYYWSVRTWDNADVVGAPCAVQQFTTYDPTPPVQQIAPQVFMPQCESQTNPTQVNTLTPNFSWTFYDANGDGQSRYRIIVASTAELLDAGVGDLWTSQVDSSSTSGITYAGSALSWDTTYYWKVRVWDDSTAQLSSSYCPRQQFTTMDVETPEPAPEPGIAVREHFRAGDAGRVLQWLGATWAKSGMRATTPADPKQPGVCLIRRISVQEDASEMVTRVYPQTAEGLTLAKATRVAPVGYTASATGQYIQHDEAVAEYGLIEAWMRFDDVSMQQNDSYVVHPELAANALADRAAEYLRTRCLPNKYYTLEVFSNQPIRVGETIRVVYHGYSDTGEYISVDDDLYIMAVTTRVDQNGLRTMTLEVSTIDVLRKSDEEILARAIRAARRAPRVKA